MFLSFLLRNKKSVQKACRFEYFAYLCGKLRKQEEMTIKNFLKKLLSSYVLLHLLAMFVVVLLLCVAVHFGLNIYTHHGEAIKVPNLEGIAFSKAYDLLQEDGLELAVGDSGYNKRLPPSTILAQTPAPGAKVKEGRTIYVTVNSAVSPTLPIPDLIDNSSYREANARLAAMGFRMMPPKVIDGEKDWVYGIECRGHRLSAGQQVSIEESLTLVIGAGYGEDEDEYDMMGEDEYEVVAEPEGEQSSTTEP